jgi:hypothetical protein
MPLNEAAGSSKMLVHHLPDYKASHPKAMIFSVGSFFEVHLFWHLIYVFFHRMYAMGVGTVNFRV